MEDKKLVCQWFCDECEFEFFSKLDAEVQPENCPSCLSGSLADAAIYYIDRFNGTK